VTKAVYPETEAEADALGFEAEAPVFESEAVDPEAEAPGFEAEAKAVKIAPRGCLEASSASRHHNTGFWCILD